jgi:VanZ family protein
MKLRALWLAIGWALVATIVWLSVTPQPPDLGIKHGDKLGHFAAYGGAMFWFCQPYARLPTRLAYAAGFIAMGIALEFVQRWLGYRTFEVADMVADSIGVLLGWTAASVIPRLLK